MAENIRKAISDVLEEAKTIHVINGSGCIIGDVLES
jgi:hypothetical protein